VGKRYQSLDGMRGLCALIVAGCHFDFALHTGKTPNHGWLSVDVFFVLSGFVIALTYENRLAGKFASFMGARARRLLPTQIVGTLLCGLTACIGFASGATKDIPGATLPMIALATLSGIVLISIHWTTLGPAFDKWQGWFPLNPPLWSLQGEWVINILYGRFFYSLRSPLILGATVAAAGWLWLTVSVGPAWPGAISGIVRAAFGFLAGVLIYRANSTGGFERLPALHPAVIYAFWFLVCCVPTDHPRPYFEASASTLIAPLFIVLLVRGERPMGKIWALLGRLSYPLYASHFALINLAPIWFPGQGPYSLWLLIPLLGVALILAWGIEWLLKTRTRKADDSSLVFSGVDGP
jgi:peptidoglycan/LPS O-acetylase OafA/YrhL